MWGFEVRVKGYISYPENKKVRNEQHEISIYWLGLICPVQYILYNFEHYHERLD